MIDTARLDWPGSASAYRPGRGSVLLHLGRSSAVALLVMSIVMPTVFQNVKAGFFFVCVASAVICMWVGESRLRRTDVWLILAAVGYSFIGLLWALYGVVRGNAGAQAMLTVHVAYPPLMMLAGTLVRPGDFERLTKVLVVAVLGVLATQGLFIASFFGLDNGVTFAWIGDLLAEGTAVVDTDGEYLIFTLPSVSSLLFFGPWLAIAAMIGHKHRIAATLLFLATLIGVMLAARRATIPAFLFSVAIGLIVARPLTTRPLRRVAMFMLLTASAIGLAFYLNAVNFDLIADRVVSILDFSTNESNIERRLQFDALEEAIVDRPLLGSGLGAVASYLRSYDQPWAYELSYMALLFQFGIFGIALYAGGIAFLLCWLASCVRSQTIPQSTRFAAACYLAGLVSFLLANATNPYLAKFDYMWTIFLPLAMVRSLHPAQRSVPTPRLGNRRILSHHPGMNP